MPACGAPSAPSCRRASKTSTRSCGWPTVSYPSPICGARCSSTRGRRCLAATGRRSRIRRASTPSTARTYSQVSCLDASRLMSLPPYSLRRHLLCALWGCVFVGKRAIFHQVTGFSFFLKLLFYPTHRLSIKIMK